MQKRNKAQKMSKAISPDDPITVVTVSPVLVNEIQEGCRKVEGLCDEYMKLLGAGK